MNITHNCLGHDLTPCHVELFKQVVQHNFSDHSRLIQNHYKPSYKQVKACESIPEK